MNQSDTDAANHCRVARLPSKRPIKLKVSLFARSLLSVCVPLLFKLFSTFDRGRYSNDSVVRLDDAAHNPAA
jgi:hypothetical protein